MADIFRTLRQLSAGPTHLNRLDADDCKTLESLGLVRLTESRHTDAEGQRSIVARLTGAGREKLYEISTAGVTPSPVGSVASRQLPDAALLALSNLRLGHPPSDLEGKALLARGLVVEDHGVYSVTRTGVDVLSSVSSQERLRSITTSHLRG